MYNNSYNQPFWEIMFPLSIHMSVAVVFIKVSSLETSHGVSWIAKSAQTQTTSNMGKELDSLNWAGNYLLQKYEQFTYPAHSTYFCFQA